MAWTERGTLRGPAGAPGTTLPPAPPVLSVLTYDPVEGLRWQPFDGTTPPPPAADLFGFSADFGDF